jgi:4-amino-4-deoxy-L-arabinose transferase-like glycosyltransferase
MTRARRADIAAAAMLAVMCVLSGGAALRESATFDEVTHVGAGLSYLQRLDLRLNPEHPPLAKAIAAVPLAVRGTRADYNGPAWRLSDTFFQAFAAQWVFGDAVLGRWNDWRSTLLWARAPMLLLTLLLGWVIYRYGTRLGGEAGGLLCLAAYVTTPTFLTFGPLVITDAPVTLFTLLALWRLGEIWAEPAPGKALWFGAALAAAALSKFTGLLLIPVAITAAVFTRKKYERNLRLRCALRGLLWGAVLAYAVLLVLSWNQPNDALDHLGRGWWAGLVRRPLMPLWIYARGVLMMLVLGSRATFVLGNALPHGVPWYFPVVFALKSTEGFLGLLVLGAAAGIAGRKAGTVIPEAVRMHWRVLKIALYVFLAVCLLSRLDISIRHFMMPEVLLILMLAPVSGIVGRLPGRRVWQAAVVALAAISFVPVVRAWPNYFPYINSLGFGRSTYELVNDSNVSWNEALPEVERFAEEQGLAEIRTDTFSLADPALVAPRVRLWNCEQPAEGDGGTLAVVAAVSILENRNCGYLRAYPARPLAGGSMWAFQLPAGIPKAGEAGGPPLPPDYRNSWGIPIDYRAWVIETERHPERTVTRMDELMKVFQGAAKQPPPAR